MLKHLESIRWSSFAQPATNTPSAIPDALRRLAAAEVESEARAAGERFLFAIGNDHAGTYFPVAIETIPFLDELLRGTARHARDATLAVLIDLAGSSQPELRARMKALIEPTRTLALDLSEEYVTRKLATDLLDLLE